MRLTNDLRDKAIQKIINKKITPKIERLVEEIVGIAQIEANKKYKGKVKDWIDLSPKGGLMTKDVFCFMFAKEHFHHDLLGGIRWGRKRSGVTIKKPIKVLKQDEYSEDLIISEKSKIGKRLKAIILELDLIEKGRDELKVVVSSALYGCTTRKQLQDSYPDLVSYVPLLEKTSKALMVTNKEVKNALSV